MNINKLYKLGAVKRSIILFVGFQAIQWLLFGISYLVNKEAWLNVAETEPISAAVGGWGSTLSFIIVNNLIICVLIVVGNLFVRFRYITPGLIVLIIQAAMIGWMAGSNGFEIPFKTVTEANIQYLSIGLWETTAYVLACAVTLPKSLLISETFPAKEWSEKHRLTDLKFTIAERIVAVLGLLMLILAAVIETIKIFG